MVGQAAMKPRAKLPKGPLCLVKIYLRRSPNPTVPRVLPDLVPTAITSPPERYSTAHPPPQTHTSVTLSSLEALLLLLVLRPALYPAWIFTPTLAFILQRRV